MKYTIYIELAQYLTVEEIVILCRAISNKDTYDAIYNSLIDRYELIFKNNIDIMSAVDNDMIIATQYYDPMSVGIFGKNQKMGIFNFGLTVRGVQGLIRKTIGGMVMSDNTDWENNMRIGRIVMLGGDNFRFLNYIELWRGGKDIASLWKNLRFIDISESDGEHSYKLLVLMSQVGVVCYIFRDYDTIIGMYVTEVIPSSPIWVEYINLTFDAFSIADGYYDDFEKIKTGILLELLYL